MQFHRPAFTLIEVLIVIAIIGILATLVIVQTGDSNRKARNASAQSDIAQMGKAVESFRIEDAASGQVVSNPSGFVDQQGGGRSDFQALFTGTQNVGALTYAAAVTKTPGTPYVYRYVASGTQTGQTGRQLVKGALNQPAYALCTTLVAATTPYFCATDASGGGALSNDLVLASESAGNISTTATTDGLAAWYKLDGDASDSSANGFNGTLVNAPTSVPGKFGQAYNFNGVNQFIAGQSAPALAPLNFTLSFWMNPSDFSDNAHQYQMLVTKTNGGCCGIDYELREFVGSGNLQFNKTVGGTQVYLSTRQVFQNGTMYHVVLTFDGVSNQATYFVNGTQDSTATYTGSIKAYTSPFQIATRGSGTFPFAGVIDDVRLYSRVLAPVEIQQLYQGTI